jgi:two-component system, NarL family, nitrate/nitrite response regulator NarL
MANDSVILIDASRLFREGLRRIFSGSAFTVIHEAASIADALPVIETLQPSLVLVDLPDSGQELTARISQIRAAAPRARTVLLTETIRGDRLADALSVGVDGYLLKSISADALHQSLLLVLMGEKVFPTDLADLLANGRLMSRGGAGSEHSNGLSDRETQILGCLVSGAQNKQIAYELKISDGTVKVHLKAILKKIHVQNRTQAAIWALAHGVKRTDSRCRDGLERASGEPNLPPKRLTAQLAPAVLSLGLGAYNALAMEDVLPALL